MSESTAKKQIRGSGLLLSGRVVSLALNLLTQVITVRYLSKTDYGLFAYALAVVSMGSSINVLGMERTVGRYVPIYEESQDPASAAGVLVFALGTVVIFGIAIVGSVIGLRGLLGDSIIENQAVFPILIILIGLVPINAIDSLLQAVLSVFGKPKAIYLRRHILGPGFKLAAVSLTVAMQGDVQTLSIAYLLAGLIVLLFYGVMLPKILREHWIIEYLKPGASRIEYRRLIRFTLPIFFGDIALEFRFFVIVAILKYLHDLAHIAEYRAVMPIARLNVEVLLSFSLLFLPMASRLLARKNDELLSEIRTHISMWVAVLSFPIFAACITLSAPIVSLILGDRYLASAPILEILAVGFFFNSALGLTQQTLRALGKIKVLFFIDILATGLTIVLAFVFIPRFGAIGAAVTTSASLIIYNCMNTAMLWRITGSNPLPWKYVRILLIVAACTAALSVLKTGLSIDSIPISILLAGLAWAIVLSSSWKSLHFSDMFPEIGELHKLAKKFLNGRDY